MSRYFKQKNNLFAILVIALLCTTAAELTARLFWYFSFDVPIFSPGRILYAYYPELQMVDELRPSQDDDDFDVLLLGGSVLHPDWGHVEEILTQKLTDNGYRDVRIFNLSMPAHTSRDSLLKYAAIEGANFDLVVFYHGLNEVRADNVPPSLYRDNYDHYSWYQIVNALSSYTSANFSLPYTLEYISLSLRQRIFDENYVPIGSPRKDWTQYGKDPRSAISFKQNIEKIIDIASQRNDPLLLLTYAIHVPKNYSWKLFWEGGLDYAEHSVPIEIWGERDHVEATVALHNDVIRELATAHSEVGLLDMDRRLPRGGRYFNDPCHLTSEGSELFADELFDFISHRIRQRAASKK